jgi:hypothetical protein
MFLLNLKKVNNKHLGFKYALCLSVNFLISLSVFANAWLTSAKLITFSGLAVLTYLDILRLKKLITNT